jgi:hypothetical protein
MLLLLPLSLLSSSSLSHTHQSKRRQKNGMQSMSWRRALDVNQTEWLKWQRRLCTPWSAWLSAIRVPIKI